MKRIVFVVQFIAFLLLLTACAQPSVTPATATPTTIATATPTLTIAASATPRATATAAPSATALPPAPTRMPTTAVQAAIWAKWQSSAHGNTYDLGKGPNTYCSRCHSPQNWDPASKVDAPPNCVSCKFASDATVRIAKSNQLVSQADWRNIGCDICHPMKDGLASKEIGWFNKTSGKYESVANATALCEKCHTDTDVLKHRIDLGKATHTGLQCTQCHDPHSTQASCSATKCHPSLSKIAGHDAAHKNVSCVACHDASALQVGPDNTTKMWTTWQSSTIAGMKMLNPARSHNVQKQADCARCHFKDNPWNLSSSVSKTP
ncbi:MAG: hypothetical protein HZB51_02655 [Chloroflexi bacterium]|nr:hypothetical protein [Chloroflexota bacterium]